MKTCYFSGCRLIKELLTRFHSNLRYQHPKWSLIFAIMATQVQLPYL
jgi:hypothetical protein